LASFFDTSMRTPGVAEEILEKLDEHAWI